MKKSWEGGISVVIPTFNRAQYLYATLICLCNQKVAENVNYEIIVVDSGDDETDKIVQLFQNAKKVPIIYKKIKKCRNRSLVRNAGAELSNYSILCFLDNDMLTPPNFIQTHFEKHQEKEKLVLMQCRRMLTNFDINEIGQEALINDFSIVEALPWYKDERLDVYENVEQWRYCFSHTLSMKKRDFCRAGKFNKQFGDHWGFEDLEIGFNLMKYGCIFELISNSFTYHQPHFSQSNKEQHETRYNKDLFLSLHNCYEVELYSTFYTDSDLFIKNVKETKEKFIDPKLKEKIRFNKILGCIYSHDEDRIASKYQLGTYIPTSKKKYKSVLILSTFFYFNELVQLSILSEAFRVSNNVYFHGTTTKDELQRIIELGRESGIILSFMKKGKYFVFKKEKDIFSKFYTLVLPEVYSPERRYVYSWLCKEFIQNKKRMIISDIHNTKNFSNDDLRIENEFVLELSRLFTNYLGMVQFQVINSSSLYQGNNKISIWNNPRSIVFHDEEYCVNYEGLKQKGQKNCIHYSNLDFANLTLASVYKICKTMKCEDKKYNYLAFMENGYYEDGIDITLEVLSNIIKTDSTQILAIKLPDYKNLFAACLPFHNESSKFSKFYHIYQKYNTDRLYLEKQINDLDLQKNVIIIDSNLSMKECLEIVACSESIVYMSRGCYVPPQIYASILFAKNVFIGEHHIIQDELKKYVTEIKSNKNDFAKELKIPISCMNIVYSAFCCDKNDFYEKIMAKEQKEKKGLHELYDAIEDKVKKAFVES